MKSHLTSLIRMIVLKKKKKICHHGGPRTSDSAVYRQPNVIGESPKASDRERSCSSAAAGSFMENVFVFFNGPVCYWFPHIILSLTFICSYYYVSVTVREVVVRSAAWAALTDCSPDSDWRQSCPDCWRCCDNMGWVRWHFMSMMHVLFYLHKKSDVGIFS